MAQRSSGYDRIDRDAYMTPAWPTQRLCEEIIGPRLPKGSIVWEPAAGNGQMVEALESRGLVAIASDISEPDRPGPITRGSNRLILGDFLSDNFLPFDFDAIITNPPYKNGLAERFVRRALDLGQRRRALVAMLLKVDFDSAKTRADIFRDHPAWGMRVVLLDRIEWFEPELREDGTVSPGSSENHAWFVWDWRGVVGRTTRYVSAPVEVLNDLRDKRRVLKAEAARCRRR